MIKQRFGVHIPKWKKITHPDPPVTIEFVITGLIPSKKNRQRASFNYSWIISQVRTFFQSRDQVGRKDAMKFFIGLVRKIRPFIFKPKELQDWEAIWKENILQQAAFWAKSYEQRQLQYPITHCAIYIKHYWADNYARDNSNREQTIHDLLVDSSIILDDKYQCLFKNSSEAASYQGEIIDHITVVSLVAYKW